ncbi:MAG: pilus assembly protein FimV, partial [Burkholderiaceae bacterium]|nr:pilus assembly protein FimV [Burkholderiaceae bacterium]
MTARIAPPDAFRQAGLQYNPVVTTMRVAIVRRANGQAVITITSGRPVNEAFMDLLVELNWANGRLMREYTFLLDPPEMRLSDAPAANGGTAQASPVAPVAAVSTPVAPAKPAAPVNAASAPAKPAVVAAAPAAGARAQPSRPAPAGASTEVTINWGDTLTAIAVSVRPAAATLDQTIISLYRANPTAFFGSPHQMYSGRTLTVPDSATTLAIDPAAARQELRESVAEFQAYRMRLAEAATEIPATKAGQAAVGAIGPKAPERAPAQPGDQLKLSKQGVSGAAARGAAGVSASGGSQGAAGAADPEAQVANEAALREMQSRMSDLEKNVADLQKLLELKNRQLADLERQLSESRMSSRPVAGAVSAAPEPAAALAPVAVAPVPAAPADGAAPVAAPAAQAPAAAPAPAPVPAPEAAKP